MKFAYVDETGSDAEGDVFVMAGVLVDAYRLRKYTATFDEMIRDFLAKHEGVPKELKTKVFINGAGGWSKVGADERKKFLSDICNLAAECSKIFAIGMSFEKFKGTADDAHKSIGKSYWLAAAIFIAAFIQRRMQGEVGNKGLTVLICDDNKQQMANLSDALYDADPWFDPIYQKSQTKKGKTVWKELSDDERFAHIVNTAFAIKSHHSSLVQVADAVAYVYRRHLELKAGDKPAWPEEAEYYEGLVNTLAPVKQTLGRRPGGACIDFYRAIKYDNWEL